MLDISTLILLLLIATAAVVVASWLRVSYTLVLLVSGLVVGASGWLPHVVPSAELILLVFLPPLIFEAAFLLDLRLLWSVRVGVLTLALPGVLVAAVVGGALVHWGLGLPWLIALLFGALVAATDPVSVLATFRDLGVGHRLRVLAEGESLLNDGTALVLLATLTTAVVTDEFSLSDATGEFIVSIVGGSLVGIAIGWIGHLMVASVDQHLTEMAVSVAIAYGSFFLADRLGLSGVLATIAAAMTLGMFGRRHGWVFTQRSHEVLTDLWELLAFTANAALFLLIGLEVSVAGLRDQPEAVIWGVGAAIAGRVVVAYLGGALLDRAGFAISVPERHVLFWGGLRGAVALAGALSLPNGFPYRDELLAMTYGAVLFTLLAQGLTVGPLVRALGLGTPPSGAGPPIPATEPTTIAGDDSSSPITDRTVQ